MNAPTIAHPSGLMTNGQVKALRVAYATGISLILSSSLVLLITG